MEKKLEALETLEKSFVGNPRMMIMALVTDKLQLRMGCNEGVVSTIMSETTPELSKDELSACAERLTTALKQYKDAAKDCKTTEQRYEKLMLLVTSEMAKESKLLSLIVQDVSDRYDTSCLATTELQDVCCWLLVKAVLYHTSVEETLVKAATSYKRKTSKKEESTSKESQEEKVEESVKTSSSTELVKEDRARDMVKNLLDKVLSVKKPANDIVREVDIELSDDIRLKLSERLSSALKVYEGVKDLLPNERSRYKTMVNCILSEFEQESEHLMNISKTVQEREDGKKLDNETLRDVSVWLSVKALVYPKETVQDILDDIERISAGIENRIRALDKRISKYTGESIFEDTKMKSADLNIFQSKDLKNVVKTENMSARKMYSIFG